MRILYIDIDSLRMDHLGCYGYHRDTSPNIDAIAAQSTRFDRCYVSDAPCLPTRSALWTGRCGFHTGVVGHGGTAADPFIEGYGRRFYDTFGQTSWMAALRMAGYHTATVSSFGERHAAWHWYAGFNEIHNPGRHGMERAHDVEPLALDWIEHNAKRDQWFLHVNLWDPHTPYRTPKDFGNPFAAQPLPNWLTEEMRQECWDGFGPNSPQEPDGFELDTMWVKEFPGLPLQLDSMEAVRQWIDGYDTAIRYADDCIGRLVKALESAGVLDETVIVISADHGENQGELNVWGDHQTADEYTCHIPLIVRWPGITDTPRIDSALHYHYDWAATLIELAGGSVPENWDGRPFTNAFRKGTDAGRPFVVTSQATWSCQRGVRFDQGTESFMALRTYHDGYKNLEPAMLFNLTKDPREKRNLAGERPDVFNRAMALLADWQHEMMLTSTTDRDPMMTVLREGGPFHTRGQLPGYVDRLRFTGREHHANRLAARHPDEV